MQGGRISRVRSLWMICSDRNNTGNESMMLLAGYSVLDYLAEHHESLHTQSRHMRVSFIVISLLCLCLELNAQNFVPDEHGCLKYQVLSSHIDSEAKPALVVFLHGGHARGDDNTAQIQLPAVQDIVEYIVGNKMSAYFVVPQCPADREWLYNNGVGGCKDDLMSLIDDYIVNKGVDREQIYLCGVSMGSWAAWHIVKEYPDMFAAAFIASGRPRYLYAYEVASTPLYVTVGTRERSMEPIRLFAIDIEKAGGEVNFDSLTGLDHRQACSKAFSTKQLSWLFSHRRSLE